MTGKVLVGAMKRSEGILIILVLLVLAVGGAFYAFSLTDANKGQESSYLIGDTSGETVVLQGKEMVSTNTPVTTETPTPTNTPTPTVTPTNTPTPTPSPTPTPEIIEITISAAGDVTLGVNQKQQYSGSFNEYYDLYGEDYFLEYVKDIFENDDFTIVNLEGVLTNSDNIRTSKEWNMKGRPEYAGILKNASVEAVSLGNNHIMDYQWEGVNDTFQNVTDYGMVYAISSPWGDQYGMYETPEGIKIGFVSVNEYYDGAAVYTWLKEGYEELRENGADIMIACTHWGGDKVYEQEPEQLELGHWCVDLGYDLILGCHPHVIQGIEYYNGAYIVHSMGNFCYGGHLNPSDKDSMIFQRTFTFVDGVLQKDSSIRVIPCSLSSTTKRNDFRPMPLTGEAAEEWVSHLNKYSEPFGLVFNAEGYLIEDAEEVTESIISDTTQQ